jgi:hypothetical protein
LLAKWLDSAHPYRIRSRKEISRQFPIQRLRQKFPTPGIGEDYYGNAYDIARDLSTIVYAHPSGQADLYLLSRK